MMDVDRVSALRLVKRPGGILTERTAAPGKSYILAVQRGGFVAGHVEALFAMEDVARRPCSRDGWRGVLEPQTGDEVRRR